jgi:hypothetical protein
MWLGVGVLGGRRTTSPLLCLFQLRVLVRLPVRLQYWKDDGDRTTHTKSKALAPNYEGLVSNNFSSADMLPTRLKSGQPQIDVHITRFERDVVQVSAVAACAPVRP